MALATGSQHMNLLAPASGAALGRRMARRLPRLWSCRVDRRLPSSCLQRQDAAKFSAGSMIAVDADYTGQTGFVGSPICRRLCATGADRCGLHPARDIQRGACISGELRAGLTLAEPLPGGVRQPAQRCRRVTGFVDREGGSFYQEWSALFVMQGSQGERIFFHYPRLQTMTGAEESVIPLDGKSKGRARTSNAQGAVSGAAGN